MICLWSNGSIPVGVAAPIAGLPGVNGTTSAPVGAMTVVPRSALLFEMIPNGDDSEPLKTILLLPENVAVDPEA